MHSQETGLVSTYGAQHDSSSRLLGIALDPICDSCVLHKVYQYEYHQPDACTRTHSVSCTYRGIYKISRDAYALLDEHIGNWRQLMQSATLDGLAATRMLSLLFSFTM